MKKLIITSLTCMFSFCAFAQLNVKSNGYTDVNNVKIDGCLGDPGYQKGGVLTLTSSLINPEYQLIAYPIYPLSLMYTCPTVSDTYSFVNYYNNQLNYYVKANGMVYTYYGLVTTSDSLQKKNIANLGSSLYKLSLLRGVTFDYKDNSPELLSKSSKSGASDQSEEISLGATPEISSRIKAENSRKRIGLVAQEVEAVFPEVVRTSFDGTKGILYNDLVAVLVEGVKELGDSLRRQDSEIAALRNEVEELKALITGKSRKNAPEGTINSDNEPIGKFKDSELFDNVPNPFNQETKISYRLSPGAANAFICIYDMNGRQLKKYPLPVNSPYGSVTVSASELAAGVYVYSLLIDNKAVDSKRMTLAD